MSEQITTRNCEYLLLVKVPNGDIHQVLIEQEAIIQMIENIGNFKVLETPIEGISFGKK